MASRNLQLPDQEECFALTDEQCRRIMDYQDPNGIRSNRDWEAEHQPLLIRLYMAMWIFPDIEHYMQSKITASRKTLQKRYRGWLFPLPRYEREETIIKLYKLVQSNEVTSATMHHLAKQGVTAIAQASQEGPPLKSRQGQQLHQTVANVEEYLSQTASQSDIDRSSESIERAESPILDVKSTLSSQQKALNDKTCRRTIIHHLAVEPLTETDLLERLPDFPSSAIKPVLPKVAELLRGTNKWQLKRMFFQELDVWSFAYNKAADRQRAIDAAVTVYDKMRLGTFEYQWDLLLAPAERGTGKCLSKFQARISQEPSEISKLKFQNGLWRSTQRLSRSGESREDNGERYAETYQRALVRALNKPTNDLESMLLAQTRDLRQIMQSNEGDVQGRISGDSNATSLVSTADSIFSRATPELHLYSWEQDPFDSFIEQQHTRQNGLSKELRYAKQNGLSQELSYAVVFSLGSFLYCITDMHDNVSKFSIIVAFCLAGISFTMCYTSLEKSLATGWGRPILKGEACYTSLKKLLATCWGRPILKGEVCYTSLKKSLATGWERPPILEGEVRVEWTCKCGHTSWDDFTERYPGAAEEHLQRFLHNQDTVKDSNQDLIISQAASASKNIFLETTVARRVMFLSILLDISINSQFALWGYLAYVSEAPSYNQRVWLPTVTFFGFLAWYGRYPIGRKGMVQGIQLFLCMGGWNSLKMIISWKLVIFTFVATCCILGYFAWHYSILGAVRWGNWQRIKQSYKTGDIYQSPLTLSTGFQKVRNFLVGSANENDLPLHDRGNTQSLTSIPTTQAAVTQDNMLFLLLCYNEGRYATKLLQLDLVTLRATSDKALFQILRQNYISMRKKWLSILSLRTLVWIKFVHFEMYRSELVDIRKVNDLPPPRHVDYRYAPAPPDVIPPIGDRHMMHLFHNPECAEDEALCFSRFPKKLKEKLKCNGGINPGWGLQFVEGWNVRKIVLLVVVCFGFGSLLIGVFWAVFKHSVQDAFSIAAYMLAFVGVTVGGIQALLVM